MRKISTVFQIDRTIDEAVDNVRPENDWVLNGEGIATIKFDGTSTLFKDGKLWKRFDRKLNKKADKIRFAGGEVKWMGDDGKPDLSWFREAPEDFMPVQDAPDPITAHWPGWVPVTKHDKWHNEAFALFGDSLKEGHTYELVGPTLALNIYNLKTHELWEHGREVAELKDRSFGGIRKFLTDNNIEGLVFHHPDGRMAKIRRKDFNLFWVMDDPRKTHTRKPFGMK